jgi:hypothetical protein
MLVEKHLIYTQKMSTTAMVSLVFAALVLPLATAAAVTTARRNCSDACGYTGLSSLYPFGIGPSCSLPGFSLTCVLGTNDVPIFHLDNSNVRLDILPSISDHNLYSRYFYSMMMIPAVHDYSVGWKAPGRPFAISGSSNMSLFVVGCDVKASMFIGNSSFEVGNCTPLCGDAQIMQDLPAGTCDGVGCCRIDIQVNLRAFTLNISRISDSARSKKVLAFITGAKDQIFRPIDALGAMLPTLEIQYTVLEWAIPYQPDCQRAMEDRTSYACVSNWSRCQDSPIGGYVCYCLWGGDEGNPYIHDQ